MTRSLRDSILEARETIHIRPDYRERAEGIDRKHNLSYAGNGFTLTLFYSRGSKALFTVYPTRRKTAKVHLAVEGAITTKRAMRDLKLAIESQPAVQNGHSASAYGGSEANAFMVLDSGFEDRFASNSHSGYLVESPFSVNGKFTYAKCLGNLNDFNQYSKRRVDVTVQRVKDAVDGSGRLLARFTAVSKYPRDAFLAREEFVGITGASILSEDAVDQMTAAGIIIVPQPEVFDRTELMYELN